MLITSSFIFVHLSKTGGTFAAQAVKEALCPNRLHRMVHSFSRRSSIEFPFYRYTYKELRQHGVCNDIPKQELGKTLVSCIRNPFDLYVSEYTFEWWKKYPTQWFRDLVEVKQAYPDFYNLNFEGFITASNLYSRWVHKALVKYKQTCHLGWYSHKFIHYFCKDPDYVFKVADDADRLFERVKKSMYPVSFLHTENLNEELHSFLLSQGLEKNRIEFIRTKGKVNVSRNDRQFRRWYSDWLRQEVETKDALILRLFPEFQF